MKMICGVIVPEKVEGLTVCLPIQHLMTLLSQKDCLVTKQELRDYHFQELHFEVSCTDNLKLEPIDTGIINPKADTYYCSCHWTTVTIV